MTALMITARILGKKGLLSILCNNPFLQKILYKKYLLALN